MAGTAATVLAAFGLGIWNGLYAFGTSWFLSLISDTPVWATTLISILVCIVAILPFIGMLYGGILLLFRLKAPRWRPGLIIFILWVVSLLALIGVSLGSLSTIRSADLILSNPPYLTAAEMAALQPETAREPACALDGGPDGLAFYRCLTGPWQRVLRPGGWLVLEIGCAQRQAVLALGRQNGWVNAACRRDYGGNPRAVWMQKAPAKGLQINN